MGTELFNGCYFRSRPWDEDLWSCNSLKKCSERPSKEEGESRAWKWRKPSNMWFQAVSQPQPDPSGDMWCLSFTWVCPLQSKEAGPSYSPTSQLFALGHCSWCAFPISLSLYLRCLCPDPLLPHCPFISALMLPYPRGLSGYPVQNNNWFYLSPILAVFMYFNLFYLFHST